MIDNNRTALHTITVLYVDSNEKARRLLGRVLSDCGFAVACAVDPSEALSQARRLPVDLVLIDYRLPEISGTKLAQKLKGLFPTLPIVMISGCAALPDSELEFVDAHFGRWSALDDLLATMRGLVLPKESRTAKQVVASRWADTT